MAKKKTPKGELMQKVLVLTMSDEEKAKKADLLAELQLEKVSVEDEKKAATSKYAARIKEIVKSINRLSREVKDGSHEQNVECTMVKNYEANTIEYWYQDQLIETREMQPEDRQMDLDEDAAPQTEVTKKRGKKRSGLSVVDATQSRDEEINDVIKSETSRKTKRSSVDGVYGGSEDAFPEV